MYRLLASLVASAVLIGPACAPGAEVRAALEIPDATIPMYGAIVGDLVLTNAGPDTLDVANPISLLGNSLRLEVLDPDGSSRVIGGLDLDLGLPPFVVLAPRAAVRYPVCLLSTGGRYFFDQEGSYTLRAECWLELDWARDGRFHPESTASVTVRAETSIAVGPPGVGRELFRARYDRWEIWRAFAGMKGVFTDVAVDSSLGEYASEHAKLLLYQQDLSGLIPALRAGTALGADDKRRMETMLRVARQCGVGEAMWTWLTELPTSKGLAFKQRGAFRILGGYILRT